eukprot:1726979-Prymnesium_polylepis.1
MRSTGTVAALGTTLNRQRCTTICCTNRARSVFSRASRVDDSRRPAPRRKAGMRARNVCALVERVAVGRK